MCAHDTLMRTSIVPKNNASSLFRQEKTAHFQKRYSVRKTSRFPTPARAGYRNWIKNYNLDNNLLPVQKKNVGVVWYLCRI